LRDLESTLKSGVLTGGPHLIDFERNFAEYVNVKHAIAVSSGTAALEIALMYFRLRGREVIVPTNTFVATPNTVLLAGGKPVFADILEDTLCIDPEDAIRRITPRTAGMIVVHIAGLPCPQTGELAELCSDRKMFLLEDCAHSHGATVSGKMTGSLGNGGCFSFYPTKLMTTGEGGMITTEDEKMARTAFQLRSHGLDSDGRMIMLGHNWRMSEIAAIIGKHQLETLEKFVSKRNAIAKMYELKLRKIGAVSVPRPPRGVRHSYYKYAVRLSEGIDRKKLAHILKEEHGIETGNVYDPPCHLHPFYRKTMGTRPGDLPVAERVLPRILCLPMHVGMRKRTVEYVSVALKDSIEKLGTRF
jgi:dTDP-4-amino-4,6-dideoxygalactose transaminase